MFNYLFRATTKFLYGFIMLLLVQTAVSAQSGKITGVVTDAVSGDPLFGANVMVIGTSIGAATDFYGEFNIPIVPYGTHIVAIRYIGYKEQTVVVDLNDGHKEHDLRVALQAEMIEGETVTVTAQAQGQMGAINQQLTSNTIKNVVSADKIRQLPDANAASALSRLPGISIMNGDQIVIRGVQAKQNLVMMNGVQLPSTDMNTRATGLGFVSSNMLSGIEVVKVVTPDMDANVIGGTVNLKLRTAPENLHVDMLAQGSFNEHDDVWGNYKGWASISNRFFDNKLGVFVQGNFDRFDGGSDVVNAGFGYSQDGPYGETPYKMNDFYLQDEVNISTTTGGSIMLDYELPKGNILFQNTISAAEYNNATHKLRYAFGTNGIVYSLSRDKNHRMLYVNALQFDYDFESFKVDLSLSHSYSDKETDIRFGDTGDGTSFGNGSNIAPFGYNSRNEPISYAAVNTLTIDEALNIAIDPDDYLGAQISDAVILREQAFEQHMYNAKLDFTIPVVFSTDVASEFKVGGKFMRTTRENDINRWYKRATSAEFYFGVEDYFPGHTITGNDPVMFTDVMDKDYTRGDKFLESTHPFPYAYDIDLLSNFYTELRKNWGPSAIHNDGTTTSDFTGTEIFSAAYLMGTFNIGSKLSIITGGRYEYYNMDYKATTYYSTHSVDGNGILLDTLNTTDRNDNDFFPNLQVRYKLNDWMDFRVAYSQTVSRPDYNAIMPNNYFIDGTSRAGNPKLKPAVSTNYDAYVSFYNNEIGLFTVGGFYKKMDDVFYQTQISYMNLGQFNVTFPDSAFWVSHEIRAPKAADIVQTFLNNPYAAHVKGLELDWQTNLWYLPAPFNSVVFNINYTRVWSEMDYQQLRNLPVEHKVLVNGRWKTVYTYDTVDTIRTARLLNQADDVLNIALGVDYKGFSGRISFNMQGNVITSVGSRPEEDNFTDNIYKWDFTLKQELPIEGLSLSLNGVNIFHNVTNTYRRFRRELGGEIGDYLSSKRYNPRVFELNLRYNL